MGTKLTKCMKSYNLKNSFEKKKKIEFFLNRVLLVVVHQFPYLHHNCGCHLQIKTRHNDKTRKEGELTLTDHLSVQMLHFFLLS